MAQVARLLLILVIVTPLSARTWQVVDQKSLAAASASSSEGDAIELAAGAEPYRGPLILKRDQTLTGSGNPVIAGGPSGALVVRGSGVKVEGISIDVDGGGDGIAVIDVAGTVTIAGGRITGSGQGAAVRISGGEGDVAFRGVAIDRTNGSAVAVRTRRGGAIAFEASPIRVAAGRRDGISIEEAAGSVTFAGELTIATIGARALYVKNGGSVAIMAASSSLTSIDAAVAELRSVTLDIVLASVSVSRTPNAHLENGLVLQRTPGRFAVSGGSIAGAKLRGIEIAHATNISLKGIALGGNAEIDGSAERCAGADNLRCNAALVLHDVDGLTVEDARIDGSGQYGISGRHVRNATFRRVAISQAGDELDEHAMHFQNLGGTIRFDECSMTRSASRGLFIENATGEADVAIDKATFSHSAAPNGGQAILFEVSGDARNKLTVSGSSFADIWTTSAHISATDRAMLDVTIRDNRFERAGGVAIVGQKEANVTIDVSSNTIGAATTAPITAQLPTAASGKLSGVISGNVIEGAKCGGCDGIGVEGRGSGRVAVTISKNTVAAVDGAGIRVVVQGSGKVDAAITANTLRDPAAASPPIPGAIRVQAGARPDDSGSLCALVEGNRISGAWPIQVVNRTGASQLRLAGYAGKANDAAAVSAFLRSGNNGAAATVMLAQQPKENAVTGGEACEEFR